MVKIFADGADLQTILELNKDERISGFTTNPTLLKKAGIKNYKDFATELLKAIPDKSISFEVFGDDYNSMMDQAEKLASWGSNVYVKIPITFTNGKSTYELIDDLGYMGINLNVTAIMAERQVDEILPALMAADNPIISIFAGRIADTGVDSVPVMKKIIDMVHGTGVQVLWASPREVLNIYQADEIGCDIITCTPDILKKLSLKGKDLKEYSLETVKMFYKDGIESGLVI